MLRKPTALRSLPASRRSIFPTSANPVNAWPMVCGAGVRALPTTRRPSAKVIPFIRSPYLALGKPPAALAGHRNRPDSTSTSGSPSRSPVRRSTGRCSAVVVNDRLASRWPPTARLPAPPLCNCRESRPRVGNLICKPPS